MNYQIKKLQELKLWDKNPRDILDNDFERLKLLISKLGLFKPFIITEDNIVLGGNMRLKACLELGIEDVPVSIVKASTDKEKLEYALADNDRAGYYVEEKLKELVISIPDFDIQNFSIDLGKPEGLDIFMDKNKEVVEDEVPEVSSEPAISKLGEVYQLGRHRVMCGDSTKIEDVEKLMVEQRADLLLTDPPYNVEYVGKTKDALTIQNDKMEDSGFLQFLTDAFTTMFMFAKDGASFYI